jgi:putative ABC transport system permease protein
MRWVRAWFMRLGDLFGRRRREQELSAEMESHLQLHIEDNLRAGMPPAQARREAFTKLGGIEQTKEAYRQQRGLPMLETFLQDLRFAARMLRKSPGFTAVSVLSLALGIGATVAIFSVIYALALRTLPVEQPEQLVEVEQGSRGNLHSYAEWKLFRDRQNIFSAVLAYNYSYNDFGGQFIIADSKGQQDVTGLYVSGGYFSTLGVSAVLGRVLQSSDDQSGATPVCVIGYKLWRQLYGQSADALGRAIRVNGNEFVIVGVAPASFFGVEIGATPEIFMPLEAERTYRDYPQRYGPQMPSLDDPATTLSIVGRLKPGVSVAKANAGLQVLGAEIYSALSSRSDDSRWQRAAPGSFSARPMPNGTSNEWLQDMDIVLLLLVMAAVALIIACGNLGNLLLARAAKRRSEIATRLALGASRWRLVRQLLTESVALSIIGAAAGLLIARWGSQALLWALSFPGGDPLRLELSWDPKLAAFAITITLACALLFGLAPALGATDISIYSVMHNSLTSGTRRNRTMNGFLVAAQVALSVALLVSAGLLARTLQALLAQDAGYDPKGVVTAHANWPGGRKNAQREVFVGEQLLAAFRSLSGVTSASWSRRHSKATLSQLVVPGPAGSERRSGSYLHFVSPDFFETWKTPVLAGREFSDTDSGTSPPVAILSADLARVLFGKVSPVGLRFRENDGDGHDYAVEVVGVVRDIQFRRPSDGPLPIFYRPVSQCGSSCSGVGGYEIRAAGGFAETAKRLEEAAATVDPRIILKCTPLSNLVSDSVHRDRAMALIATAFSLFVGLLAMIGVYGVTSHAAAERTREIGIRMALGADRGDVFRMLLGEMTRTVCIGIAFGVGAGIAAAQLIRGTLWGVKPTDPMSIGFAVGLMLLIAGIAAFLPARRAMRVDPMVALRYE